jgi:uncharacterized repeat protein (TIGR03847 family)
VVQLEEMLPASADPDEVEEEEDLDRGQIRVYVKRSQAVAFCERAEQVVAAGRPNCQWCERPIDPDGHPCPRMN